MQSSGSDLRSRPPRLPAAERSKTSDRAEDDSIVAHNFRKVNSLSIKRAKMRKESWQNSGKYDENRKRY